MNRTNILIKKFTNTWQFSHGRGFAEVKILKKSNWPQLITKSSPRNRQMTFIIGGGFAELQTLIKLELAPSLELWNIRIIFSIHTDIDKLQPKVLPNVVFIETGPNSWTVRMFSYNFAHWQDLAQRDYQMQIANVEALPDSKIWKNLTGPNSWTVCYILMTLCIIIDIDKI